MIALERRIHLTHHADGLFVFGADDNAIRAVEVVDGCAFFEKFRV